MPASKVPRPITADARLPQTTDRQDRPSRSRNGFFRSLLNSAATSPLKPPGIQSKGLIDPLRSGIGLRTEHYQEMLETLPEVSFLEVHSENYFGEGGQPLAYLELFRSKYPLSLHGVGLSLGSIDPLNPVPLARLKRLVERFKPALVSDHLCWVGLGGNFLNDLLPLPYTGESLRHMTRRVQEAQDFLGRQMLVENVSSYLEYEESTIPEWEFVAELVHRSGCGLLLDVNNIYVNAVNHDFDPTIYLRTIAAASVQEIHLAGFDRLEAGDGAVLIDTHGKPVSQDVWQLYDAAIALCGPVPTLIEWDTDIPPLRQLLQEAEKANQVLRKYDEHAA